MTRPGLDRLFDETWKQVYMKRGMAGDVFKGNEEYFNVPTSTLAPKTHNTLRLVERVNSSFLLESSQVTFHKVAGI